jgi:glycosyltransferase involved in cell wall biosynthesis
MPSNSNVRTDVEPPRPLVSLVIPCLNEIQTIATCVNKARRAFAEAGLCGEVVVVDNGSSDGSAATAAEAGAIVVKESRRGYGSAYLSGFAQARGQYLLMGDGDDTYDFLEIPRFLAPLLAGSADFVIGDRLGGDIKPGAMSWSHRWIGNPILSGMLRLLFRTRVADSHCGMRAFTREAWERMRLGALGMEFASEMVVAALRERFRIVELPIAYYPRLGESKLQGLRDAWRHTRFMLMFSPSYLFLLPGMLLVVLGLATMAALIGGPREVFGRTWDYHPLLFGAAAVILGYNLVLFDLLAKCYSMASGFARPQQWGGPLLRWFSLERGLALGLTLLVLGVTVEGRIVYAWVQSGYAGLMAVREVVLGMALMVVGLQTVFASFLVGLMHVARR